MKYFWKNKNSYAFQDPLVEEIIRSREIKNERVVATVRLLVLGIATLQDVLGHFGLVSFLAVVPPAMTLFFDLTFASFAGIVFLLSRSSVYRPWLKFFVITLDYLFVGMMVLFDPTISHEPVFFIWASLVSVLFIFLLNLLRFSLAGTLYAAIFALLQFCAISLLGVQESFSDFGGMVFGLLMMLGIGYVITDSNMQMMKEANVKKMLERYLPSQLASEMFNQEFFRSIGDNKEVVILFSDIRSFTTISERVPARIVVEFLNEYLTIMTEVIFEYGGTIDKFIGDAILSVFGALVSRTEDALCAVNAAIAMQQKLKVLGEKWSTRLGTNIEAGIGIHFGEVIMGNIGSVKRMDFTVIGDNVNLASRIEGLTSHYHSSILVSEEIVKRTPPGHSAKFLFREIDTVLVKGKTRKITVFEVIF